MTPDRDMLIAYAMGALSPEEEREVAAYLKAHPEDAAFVRDLFESLAHMALSEAPAEVPEAAGEALLARIRQRDGATAAAPAEVLTLPRPGAEQKPREQRRLWWLGLAVAAALALLAWVALFRPPDPELQIARQLERTCAEASVTCEPLYGENEQELGTLARREDNQLLVVLDDAPPAGQVYQAWEIVGETPRSLGIYQGRVLQIDQSLEPGSAFGITLEPPGGSPAPTSVPLVVLPLQG